MENLNQGNDSSMEHRSYEEENLDSFITANENTSMDETMIADQLNKSPPCETPKNQATDSRLRIDVNTPVSYITNLLKKMKIFSPASSQTSQPGSSNNENIFRGPQPLEDIHETSDLDYSMEEEKSNFMIKWSQELNQSVESIDTFHDTIPFPNETETHFHENRPEGDSDANLFQNSNSSYFSGKSTANSTLENCFNYGKLDLAVDMSKEESLSTDKSIEPTEKYHDAIPFLSKENIALHSTILLDQFSESQISGNLNQTANLSEITERKDEIIHDSEQTNVENLQENNSFLSEKQNQNLHRSMLHSTNAANNSLQFEMTENLTQISKDNFEKSITTNESSLENHLNNAKLDTFMDLSKENNLQSPDYQSPVIENLNDSQKKINIFESTVLQPKESTIDQFCLLKNETFENASESPILEDDPKNSKENFEATFEKCLKNEMVDKLIEGTDSNQSIESEASTSSDLHVQNLNSEKVFNIFESTVINNDSLAKTFSESIFENLTQIPKAATEESATIESTFGNCFNDGKLNTFVDLTNVTESETKSMNLSEKNLQPISVAKVEPNISFKEFLQTSDNENLIATGKLFEAQLIKKSSECDLKLGKISENDPIENVNISALMSPIDQEIDSKIKDISPENESMKSFDSKAKNYSDFNSQIQSSGKALNIFESTVIQNDSLKTFSESIFENLTQIPKAPTEESATIDSILANCFNDGKLNTFVDLTNTTDLEFQSKNISDKNTQSISLAKIETDLNSKEIVKSSENVDLIAKDIHDEQISEIVQNSNEKGTKLAEILENSSMKCANISTFLSPVDEVIDSKTKDLSLVNDNVKPIEPLITTCDSNRQVQNLNSEKIFNIFESTVIQNDSPKPFSTSIFENLTQIPKSTMEESVTIDSTFENCFNNGKLNTFADLTNTTDSEIQPINPPILVSKLESSLETVQRSENVDLIIKDKSFDDRIIEKDSKADEVLENVAIKNLPSIIDQITDLKPEEIHSVNEKNLENVSIKEIENDPILNVSSSSKQIECNAISSTLKENFDTSEDLPSTVILSKEPTIESEPIHNDFFKSDPIQQSVPLQNIFETTAVADEVLENVAMKTEEIHSVNEKNLENVSIKEIENDPISNVSSSGKQIECNAISSTLKENFDTSEDLPSTVILSKAPTIEPEPIRNDFFKSGPVQQCVLLENIFETTAVAENSQEMDISPKPSIPNPTENEQIFDLDDMDIDNDSLENSIIEREELICDEEIKQNTSQLPATKNDSFLREVKSIATDVIENILDKVSFEMNNELSNSVDEKSLTQIQFEMEEAAAGIYDEDVKENMSNTENLIETPTTKSVFDDFKKPAPFIEEEQFCPAEEFLQKQDFDLSSFHFPKSYKKPRESVLLEFDPILRRFNSPKSNVRGKSPKILQEKIFNTANIIQLQTQNEVVCPKLEENFIQPLQLNPSVNLEQLNMPSYNITEVNEKKDTKLNCSKSSDLSESSSSVHKDLGTVIDLDNFVPLVNSSTLNKDINSDVKKSTELFPTVDFTVEKDETKNSLDNSFILREANVSSSKSSDSPNSISALSKMDQIVNCSFSSSSSGEKNVSIIQESMRVLQNSMRLNSTYHDGTTNLTTDMSLLGNTTATKELPGLRNATISAAQTGQVEILNRIKSYALNIKSSKTEAEQEMWVQKIEQEMVSLKKLREMVAKKVEEKPVPPVEPVVVTKEMEEKWKLAESMAKEIAKLRQENAQFAQRNQSIRDDLNVCITAYTSYYSKYAKLKSEISDRKISQESLIATIEVQKMQLEKAKDIFDPQLVEDIEMVNKKLSQQKTAGEGEIYHLQARIKQAELKCKSLESALQQKAKEVNQMNEICDNLMNNK